MALTKPKGAERVKESGAAEKSDVYWLTGAGVGILLILSLRIGLRHGWGGLNRNGLQWLQLARALVRFCNWRPRSANQRRNEISIRSAEQGMQLFIALR